MPGAPRPISSGAGARDRSCGPPLIWCVMACFALAGRRAMPCPCPPRAYACRRPRGDSVPSVIVLFRVDHCRIPVECSHLQNMRYARHGTSPPLGFAAAAAAGCVDLRSPDKSRIRKSDMHRWHGAQHLLSDFASHAARLLLVMYLLVKGLAMMFVSPVRLFTSPSGIVTIALRIDLGASLL